MVGISVGALLVGLALLLVVTTAVAVPFLHRREERPGTVTEEVDEEATDRARHRTRVLLALRDLEFDYLTGKVSEEDYHTLRPQLLLEAAALLQGSETGSRTTSAGETPSTSYLDALIEQAVRAKRHNRCPHCGHPSRPGARFCVMCGQPLTGAFRCPECGTPVIQNARFCTACGHPLTPVQEAGG